MSIIKILEKLDKKDLPKVRSTNLDTSNLDYKCAATCLKALLERKYKLILPPLEGRIKEKEDYENCVDGYVNSLLKRREKSGKVDAELDVGTYVVVNDSDMSSAWHSEYYRERLRNFPISTRGFFLGFAKNNSHFRVQFSNETEYQWSQSWGCGNLINQACFLAEELDIVPFEEYLRNLAGKSSEEIRRLIGDERAKVEEYILRMFA